MHSNRHTARFLLLETYRSESPLKTAYLSAKRVRAVAIAGLLMAFAAAPVVGFGADHLDAPSLTSPGGDGALDIADVFVFEGENSSNTALVMTTNPAAGALSSQAFATDALYQLKIDIDGDAVADMSAQASFIGDAPNQEVVFTWATGADAESNAVGTNAIAGGGVNEVLSVSVGGQAFAGLRSDPFFFDLGGFLGTVEGNGPRQLNDGDESDFFAELNVNAIVIELPDTVLGTNIAVWATTHRDGVQIDRMGRPAINTVVNSPGPIVGAPVENKNVFNGAKPEDDVVNFTQATVAALQAYSSLDTEGAYSDEAAGALAAVLLPDVVTYDTSTSAAGPLNGRALVDDVIDIELGIVTGGDPLGLFADRDADGAINTDGIGPHTDYLGEFPYLGVPHISSQITPGVNDAALLGGVRSDGQWIVPGAGDPFYFGVPGDIPFLGDWDGDGVATPGLYRASTGFAYVRDTNDFGTADREWFMGIPNDIPLVGDWDGDGTDSFGVYRPAEGKVYLRNAQSTGSADVSYFFGNPGDAPFAGDFDGDGTDTVGLFRESVGLVYFRNSQTTGNAESQFFWGVPGDRFVGGDWDGDGIDTVGVLRGDTFFGRNSNTLGEADFQVQVDGSLKPIVSPQIVQ